MALKESAGDAGTNSTVDHFPPEGSAPAFATLNIIVASLTNPRRTFDQAKLAELAASISQVGVLQPILVRPLPAARVADTAKVKPRPVWEIVAGERRYRASQAAGLKEIPIVVRPLTDAQVLEVQLVENLQRDDLQPLEEAEGYQRLIDATSIRKEDIAGKINRSRTYVYNRLKLLTLTAESRDALREGKLDTSRAELLATVADTKLQAKALKEATRTDYKGDTPSVREFRTWLQQNVLLKMDSAPFDVKSKTLVEGCGACEGCPKRTHADRDLFAAFDGPDMCTDAPCWNGKVQAHEAAITAMAAKDGLQVISGKEALKLKPQSYSSFIPDLVPMEEKVALAGGGNTTVKKVIADTDVKPVIFIDPHTHVATKMVPKAALGEALKAKGIESPRHGARKETAADKAAKLKAQIERVTAERSQLQVGERIGAGAVQAFSGVVLRILLVDLLHSYNDVDPEVLAELWHLPAEVEDSDEAPKGKGKRKAAAQPVNLEERLCAHAMAAPDTALGAMYLQALLTGESPNGYLAPDHEHQRGGKGALLQALARECDVDLEAIKRDVAKELKAPPAKAPAKPAGATSQAAPQGSKPAKGENSAGKGPRATSKPAGGGGKGKAAAAPRNRLSAAEAQQGIAEAMQGEQATSEADEREAVAFANAVNWPPFLDTLRKAGVTTRKQLAELEVDRLVEITATDPDTAATLIESVREELADEAVA